MSREIYSAAWSCYGRHAWYFDDLFSSLWLFTLNANNIFVWHGGRLVARQATYSGV